MLAFLIALAQVLAAEVLLATAKRLIVFPFNLRFSFIKTKKTGAKLRAFSAVPETKAVDLGTALLNAGTAEVLRGQVILCELD